MVDGDHRCGHHEARQNQCEQAASELSCQQIQDRQGRAEPDRVGQDQRELFEAHAVSSPGDVHREHRPPRGERQSVDLAGPSEAYELGDRNDHPYPDGEPSDDIDGDHRELQTRKGTAQRYRQETGRLRRVQRASGADYRLGTTSGSRTPAGKKALSPNRRMTYQARLNAAIVAILVAEIVDPGSATRSAQPSQTSWLTTASTM